MTACPSDLALEAHLLEPERSRVALHVQGCSGCAARLARMESEGERFRRFVFPVTVAAVEEAAVRPRSLGRLLAPAAALAAAAGALLLVLRPAPGPEYVGVKGGGLGLGVFVGEGGRAAAVPEGGAVPAAAALRFTVRAAPGCRLWIASVDGAGQVSRLFPAEGEAPAVPQTGAVPGGAVLDGRAGPERIFAVCADGPLPWATIERSARAAAGGGADRVRAAQALAGLPPGARQATVLVEKRR